LAEPRRYAAVIGPGSCDEETAALAEQVGGGLARAGFTLVTGGAFGAMEAASRGAQEAGGFVVGLLPGTDRAAGNEWSDVAIATGLGDARNLAVVAAADVVVAVGGGWGTLSEIGLAGVVGRPVVLLAGWQLEHAGGLPSEISYAETAAQAVSLARARVEQASS
jgi:uncharacterized protein (TIGR00725 family)